MSANELRKESCMTEWNRMVQLLILYKKEKNNSAAEYQFLTLDGYTKGLFWADVITEKEFEELNDKLRIIYYELD